MSNENNASINKNEPVIAGRNSELDISSLLKQSREAEEPKKEKSPLELMKEAKENGALGLVVDNKDLEEKNRVNPKGQKSIMDAESEADSYMKEQDKLINAAKTVQISRPPRSKLEMVALIDNLDQVSKTGTVSDTIGGTDSFIVDKDAQQKSETNTAENNEPVETVFEQKDTTEEDSAKSKIVNILIDKTGVGGNITFTEEEYEKMTNSAEIRLKEVETVDLKTIKVKRAEKSFLEKAKEMRLASSKVPMVFPASNFRADMTSLSYGEMGDIALNPENITFDQLRKKLTVLYNKMKNPTCGEFEDFEDFLKKFAYTDIDLATYGLIIATFPDFDEIPLNCNNPSCKQRFNHRFSPRSLLRYNKCGEKFNDAVRRIVDCPPADYQKLAEEAPVRNSTRIKLPISGFIIETGIVSCYEYLYTVVDNILGDKFSNDHPDDVNGILKMNVALLSLIRKVYVPDDDGESYIEFDEFEDMINALYMIKPEEVAILNSILRKYGDSYRSTFELTGVECPYCHTKTESIEMDLDYLVFLKYQRLMATDLNIDSISVL